MNPKFLLVRMILVSYVLCFVTWFLGAQSCVFVSFCFCGQHHITNLTKSQFFPSKNNIFARAVWQENEIKSIQVEKEAYLDLEVASSCILKILKC